MQVSLTRFVSALSKRRPIACLSRKLGRGLGRVGWAALDSETPVPQAGLRQLMPKRAGGMKAESYVLLGAELVIFYRSGEGRQAPDTRIRCRVLD